MYIISNGWRFGADSNKTIFCKCSWFCFFSSIIQRSMTSVEMQLAPVIPEVAAWRQALLHTYCFAWTPGPFFCLVSWSADFSLSGLPTICCFASTCDRVVSFQTLVPNWSGVEDDVNYGVKQIQGSCLMLTVNTCSWLSGCRRPRVEPCTSSWGCS